MHRERFGRPLNYGRLVCPTRRARRAYASFAGGRPASRETIAQRVSSLPAVPSLAAIPATFQLGSLAPDNPANVLTDLPARAADGPAPRIASRQQYVEFTLEGASSDVRPADLALYANDRLVSLRKTRLVKIADEGGRATYRLLGIPHVSSARATFTFVVNGPGGGASTTWRRG